MAILYFTQQLFQSKPPSKGLYATPTFVKLIILLSTKAILCSLIATKSKPGREILLFLSPNVSRAALQPLNIFSTNFVIGSRLCKHQAGLNVGNSRWQKEDITSCRRVSWNCFSKLRKRNCVHLFLITCIVLPNIYHK